MGRVKAHFHDEINALALARQHEPSEPRLRFSRAMMLDVLECVTDNLFCCAFNEHGDWEDHRKDAEEYLADTFEDNGLEYLALEEATECAVDWLYAEPFETPNGNTLREIAADALNGYIRTQLPYAWECGYRAVDPVQRRIEEQCARGASFRADLDRQVAEAKANPLPF